MVQDKVSDFIIQLKNAGEAGRESIVLPSSKLVDSIADLLQEKQYIEVQSQKGKKGAYRTLTVKLKKTPSGKPAIGGVKRKSKLSKRVYAHAEDLYPVRHGYGMAVISTSKGLMSGEDARKAHLGGEVLFEIW